ncbi:MAG: HAMP domain-containing histidine kinase [Eubacterium sp.]|nr:HAMP domain-containing histidine kinase [Eubacterium sp.]
MMKSLLTKLIAIFLVSALVSFALIYFVMPAADKNVALITYVIVLAVFLIAFAIVYFLYIKPLKKIRTAAMEYANGHFDYDGLDINRKDEIGDVATSLNYMADQLENTREYQRDFISNISHDFRSPLTSIKGYLEAMIDGTIPPEEYDHYLKTVLAEADRLENLTTGLLNMDGYGTEGLELILENFDMEQVVTEAVETFEGRCNKKKLEVIMKFPSHHYLVYGDKGKYEQVLYNLLDNAIKFSPSSSKIIISLYNQGDKQYCSIKDFGPGIPADKIDKIFQRFYKSDSSRGRDKTGNGIGLSIVKEIIMAHNETIDVISTEGAGCEFVFSISKAK